MIKLQYTEDINNKSHEHTSTYNNLNSNLKPPYLAGYPSTLETIHAADLLPCSNAVSCHTRSLASRSIRRRDRVEVSHKYDLASHQHTRSWHY